MPDPSTAHAPAPKPAAKWPPPPNKGVALLRAYLRQAPPGQPRRTVQSLSHLLKRTWGWTEQLARGTARPSIDDAYVLRAEAKIPLDAWQGRA